MQQQQSCAFNGLLASRAYATSQSYHKQYVMFGSVRVRYGKIKVIYYHVFTIYLVKRKHGSYWRDVNFRVATQRLTTFAPPRCLRLPVLVPPPPPRAELCPQVLQRRCLHGWLSLGREPYLHERAADIQRVGVLHPAA